MSKREILDKLPNKKPRLIEKSHYNKMPSDWNWVDLLSLCDIQSGISDDQVEVETNVPVSRIETISDGTVDFDAVKYIQGNKENYEKYKYKNGDLIFSNINSEEHIGKTAIFNSDNYLYHGMNILRLHNIMINNFYLFYTFNTPTQKRIWKRTSQPAVNQCSINQTMLKQSRIPVPSLSEQERIASVLYSVDEQVRSLHDRHDELTQLKHGLMQDLLTGQKRFSDRSIENKNWMEKPSKILHKTTVGEIPKDWSVASLSTLSEGSLYGLNESAKGQDDGKEMVEFIRVTNLQSIVNGLNKEMKFVDRDKVGDKTLKKNDILFARSGSVGKTYLVEKEEDMTYGGYMIRYRIDEEKINPEYLLQFTKSPSYWDWIERVSRGGVQQNISTQEYDDLMVPIPPEEEQERIASVLYTVDEMIARTSELIDEYERLKRGLMQDLLSGNIRTPEDLEVLEEVMTEN